MDTYYEKSVVSESIERHKKRNKLLTIMRTVFLVLTFAVAIFIFAFFGLIGPEDTGAVIAIKVVMCVFMVMTPLAFYLALTSLQNRSNAEYDYFLIGDLFRVVRVINRKKRKKFVEFPIARISSIGIADSEQFEKLAADRDIKKVVAYCNDDELVGYFYTQDEGVKKLVMLEFDRDLLKILKRAVPLSVFDSSIKTALAKIEKSAGYGDEDALKDEEKDKTL